ncbi:MAG: N-acetyltransferase [Flavobacteriales bacterium]|nr:N-acetyltransferase [Flavobacteriales bacterium]
MVRNAELEDLPFIMEIYNHSILKTTSVYSYEPHTPERIQEWYKNKLDNNFPVLVSVEDNTITGFASFGSFRNWPAYKYTVEHSVHIHPEHRRKGEAGALMKSLISLAKKSGYHSIIGGIDASNEGSILFHKKLGFKEVGLIKEVGYKFDRWLDLAFYQLML